MASSSSSDPFRWPGRPSELRIFVDVASASYQRFAEFAVSTNPYLEDASAPSPLECTHAVLDDKLPLLNLPLRDHLHGLGRGIEVVTLEWLKRCLFTNETVEEEGYRLEPADGAAGHHLVNGKGKQRESPRSASTEAYASKRARTSDVADIGDATKKARHSVDEQKDSLRQTSSRSADRSPHPSSTFELAGPSRPAPAQSSYTQQDFDDWCNILVHFGHLSPEQQRIKFLDEHPGRTGRSLSGWISSAEPKAQIKAKVRAIRTALGLSSLHPPPSNDNVVPRPLTQSRTPEQVKGSPWTDEEDYNLAYCLASNGTGTISDACRKFVSEFSPQRTEASVTTRYSSSTHRARLDALVAEIKEDLLERGPVPTVQAPTRIPASLVKNAFDRLHSTPVSSPQPRPRLEPAAQPARAAVEDAMAMLHNPAASASPAPAVRPKPSVQTSELPREPVSSSSRIRPGPPRVPIPSDVANALATLHAPAASASPAPIMQQNPPAQSSKSQEPKASSAQTHAVAGPASVPRPDPAPSAVANALASLHGSIDPAPSAPLRKQPIHPSLPPKPTREAFNAGISALFAPEPSGSSASSSQGRPIPPVVMNVNWSDKAFAVPPRVKRSTSPKIASPRGPNPFSRESSARPATPNLSRPSKPTADELATFRRVGGRPPGSVLAESSDAYCYLCGVVGARQYEKVELHKDSGDKKTVRACDGCAVFLMEEVTRDGPVKATQAGLRRGRSAREAKSDEMAR